MASPPRRAVITGLGLVTPLGLDLTTFWEALRDGRNGVRRVQAFDPSSLPVQFGGEIDRFDARNYLDKKERKRLNVMPRSIQLAVAASQLALDDSGVDKKQLDPARFGVVFGAGTIPGDLAELGPAAQASGGCDHDVIDTRAWAEKGLPCIPPMWLLNHVPNMAACHVSILHNAQGPNNSITQTELGGLLAVGEAWRTLARDRGDLFLVGGADTRINPVSMVRQSLFASLSRRNDAPEKACRPFDRGRDGQVLGEGGGVLVLEELQHARRRGARIYAEVVGFGAAFDRDQSGAGLARAIGTALAEAGVTPAAIDHVNAHGASTLDGDIWEARGLHEIFGGARTPVFAPKSSFGNLGAGCATTELAASLLALAHGLLPGTLNYEEPDPACPVRVCREPRPVTSPYILKVGCTELGQCAAVVLRQGE